MEFEWDDAKSDRTRQERGFGFDDAALIFEGPVIEWRDERQQWGEVRMVAVGELSGRLITVVYTDRAEARRIISARVARKKEREKWQLSVAP
ncbi:MAG: BrnT family toxin [Ancalomicrobiaceae bacterium]|nr:BrnT family toxin [Ancalomicrobiaceae bacterium]